MFMYLLCILCLGSIPNLNQYKPWRVTDVIKWEFFGSTIYSDENLNPRRRPETHLRAGIEDVVREVSLIYGIQFNIL